MVFAGCFLPTDIFPRSAPTFGFYQPRCKENRKASRHAPSGDQMNNRWRRTLPRQSGIDTCDRSLAIFYCERSTELLQLGDDYARLAVTAAIRLTNKSAVSAVNRKSRWPAAWLDTVESFVNQGITVSDPLPVNILPQPDDWTCGPTCLHAVYRFFGEEIELPTLIARVPKLDDGGTLAVMLGCDALRHGYVARIYTFNLTVFDPTWFRDPAVDLKEKLAQQAAAKEDAKLRLATVGYLDFLRLGGDIRMRDLSPSLIRKYLARNQPLLCGLSSTYLYGEPREINSTQQPNDICGVPQGHFVVLHGYNNDTRRVLVSDPYHKNPLSDHQEYEVPLARAVTAILLGVLTYDANFLVIRPAR